MDKLYALCPINVGGTEYKPGEEIECGDGARASLLRCGQASTKEPTMSAEEPTPTPESQDELTALSELGLEEQVIEKLQENNMRSIEELFAYIDGGKKLSKLAGIGDATATKINEAIEQYLQPETDEDGVTEEAASK